MSHKPDPVEDLHAALLRSELKLSGAAKLIGRSPGVMYNKFCGTTEAEPTAREALALADVIHSDVYAESIAAYFGGVFFRLPDGQAGDDDVMGAYLEIIKRMGELSGKFISARADGVVDSKEFAEIRNDAFLIMAALRTYIAELETMVRDIPAAPAIPIRGSGSR